MRLVKGHQPFTDQAENLIENVGTATDVLSRQPPSQRT